MRNKKINRAHVRVMLDYLGIPFNQQGRTADENREMLRQYSVVEPESYQRAYDIIVDHKLPESDGAANADRDKMFRDMGNLVADHFKTQESAAVKNIEMKSAQLLVDAYDNIKKKAQDEIAEAAKKFITIKVKVGSKAAKKIDGIIPESFEKMLQLAQERVNILQVGPAGCGKTHNASLLADALDLPYASQSCSAGVSESVFSGWLLPTGKDGRFNHVASEFINIYENGGVFLFDEIDASDPNVLVFINQALANGEFYLPQRFGKTKVVKHPDFVAIAAANTFGTGADALYHARNALDAATLDRFKMGTVVVDYSKTVEEQLINPDVLAWGRIIRQKIRQHKLRKVMSTRVMLDATKMVNGQDWTIQDVDDAYFSDWGEDEIRVVRN